MGRKYRIESLVDSRQAIELLEDKIYEFNSAKLNRTDGKLFSRTVSGKNKEIIAGVAGWTWADACEITQLWVDKAARGQGLGKQLLMAAEKEAKANGCQIIMVKSYSFQAPYFYEKYGYSIEHVLKDFPKGHNHYLLIKRMR